MYTKNRVPFLKSTPANTHCHKEKQDRGGRRSYLPHFCYSTRDPITINHALELATTWPRPGHRYIGPRRNCFPLPSDYSLGDSQIPLDKLAMKAITNIISYKKRRPTNALAK
jgi:hypothetical protein